MKQHVTPQQLREISKERLVEVYGNKYGSALNTSRKDFYEYHHKKFTIGKIIEILKNKNPYDLGHLIGNIIIPDFVVDYHGKELELCDALWEELKLNL